MDRSAALFLAAFAGLAASALLAMASQGRLAWRQVQVMPQGGMRPIVLVLLVCAAVGLGTLTSVVREYEQSAEAQAQAVAADVVALDVALRALGPAANGARMTLFRFADGVARALHPRHGERPRLQPAALEALRAALRDEVQSLVAGDESRQVPQALVDAVLRAHGGLTAASPISGQGMLRTLLLGWLLLGVMLATVLAPPQGRNPMLLTGLAFLLSVGLFLLEEWVSPLGGSASAPRMILDAALFAIAD